MLAPLGFHRSFHTLYLWHWPILVFSQKFIAESVVFFVGSQIGVSPCLAVLSWRFVEVPLREKRWLSERRSMLRTSIICMATLILCGGILSATKGLRKRLPEAVRQLTENPPDMDYNPNIEVSLNDLKADRVPIIGSSELPGEPTFVLWGDSHAMALHPVLDVLGRQHHKKGAVISRRGTAPLVGTWRPAEGRQAFEFHQAALDYIRRHQVRTVLLVSFWAVYTEGAASGHTEYSITDDDKLPMNAEACLAVLERGIVRTIEALRGCGVRRIGILRQVPQQPIHVKDVLTARMLAGLSVEHLGAELGVYEKSQQRLDVIFAGVASDDVSVLDPESYLFGPDGRTILVHRGRVTFEDQGHLSVEGALLLRPLFESYFTP
ncbi:MAG: SGNH hydrolase domain-containing protein [Prosthecobacter sp.]